MTSWAVVIWEAAAAVAAGAAMAADAFLEAALAALAAVAVAVPAEYGHRLWAGFTAVGLSLHPRLTSRLALRSKWNRQYMPLEP